jgi:hypothetical protein
MSTYKKIVQSIHNLEDRQIQPQSPHINKTNKNIFNGHDL